MKKKLYLLAGFMFLYLAGVTQWAGWKGRTAYALARPARLVHTKDITGDGKPDLTAFATAAERSFVVLKGQGDGRFAAPEQFAKEENYHLSDIADLNQDGHPDLVISSYWNNGFKIYYGKGNGQFAEGIYMHTGVHGRDVQCADINRDGHMDIVAVTSGSGQPISLHHFLGKGDGSFQPNQTVASVLDTSKEIFITDKNSDGWPDVAVSSSFPWFVVFVQQADGRFEPEYEPTFTTAQLAFADVNRDNREDVVLLYASFDNFPAQDSLVIRLNTGGASYGAGKKIPLTKASGMRSAFFRTTDVNKDGYTDSLFNQLDTSGNYTDTVFYLLGKADSAWDAPAFLKLPAPVVELQTADVDGDGYPECIVSCADSHVYVVANGGQSTTGTGADFEIFPNPAKKKMVLRTGYGHPYKVNLYTADGRLVKSWRFNTPVNTLPVEGLSAGLYFVEVAGRGKNKTKKVFIEL